MWEVSLKLSELVDYRTAHTIVINYECGPLPPPLWWIQQQKNLDLQKGQEIIRKHHQTFLHLFWMKYCNAILPSGKLSNIHNLCQNVRGDSEHFYVWVIFWKWEALGANCLQGINSSYNSIEFCINKKKILIFIFAMYQNYPLALKETDDFYHHVGLTFPLILSWSR